MLKSFKKWLKIGSHELLITNKNTLIIFIVEIVKIGIQVLDQTSFFLKNKLDLKTT